MSLSVASHFVVLYHTLLWEKRKRKPAADDKNHASSAKNPTWKTVLWTSTWTSIPFQRFSLINFPIPCDMTTVIFFAKAHSWKKMTQFQWKQVHENETKRLLGNQSFNKGSLDTITWCIQFVYQNLWKPSIGEKLVTKQEFNKPMDKRAMKVVKGDETVSHLPCKFSWIVWYFLARSGEISVIGRRRCGGMEAPCQLAF